MQMICAFREAEATQLFWLVPRLKLGWGMQFHKTREQWIDTSPTSRGPQQAVELCDKMEEFGPSTSNHLATATCDVTAEPSSAR